MEHPSCPPNLAPNELFPKVNSFLKGRTYPDIEVIRKNVTSLSYFITGVGKKCFQHWQHLRAKCIAAQGEYLEGDPSQ